jgi:hypothetical protein
MKTRHVTAITTLILGATMMASQAENMANIKQQAGTTIDIAGHPVPVVAGGLYDRYRSNPPLSIIANEAPDLDLSWFKTLTKEKVNIGFDTYSPNFFYKDSSITAVFTADIERLKELIPPEVRAQVQPLQVWLGRGAVALTAYAYHYCDNDAYNEISLSIVTNKPGSPSFGPISLLGQSRSKNFWGYVLKLPVNTELARVRGVVGYNLPKWLSDINFRESDEALTFQINDLETGKPDVIFEGKKLRDLSSEVAMVTNSFTNMDRSGRLTYGHTVARQLSHASSTKDDAIALALSDGSLSTYIKSLKLGTMLKYEYVPEFQGALYAPRPLATIIRGK